MAIHERPGGASAACTAAGSHRHATPRADGAAGALLRLQRRAGNRATGAMLARRGGRDRDRAPAPAERAGARTRRMTVAGLGSFELHSFSLRERSSIVVVFDAGGQGARFLRAASEGESFE